MRTKAGGLACGPLGQALTQLSRVTLGGSQLAAGHRSGCLTGNRMKVGIGQA